MWIDQVACKPEQHKLFFSELPSKVAKAKAICNECPSKSSCLDFALKNDEEFGIFGGLTPKERKAIA